MDDEQSDEEEDEADTDVERMVTDADDELTIGESPARMEDEPREGGLPTVKLEAAEGANPFSESGREDVTVGTRSEGRVSWDNENPFSDGASKSERDYEETGVYTASPNRCDQVTVAVKKEEEPNDSDCDVVTALMDHDALKKHKPRRPTSSASAIALVNRESIDGASPTLSRELTFDVKTTPTSTPAQSPSRNSVCDLRAPSSLSDLREPWPE